MVISVAGTGQEGIAKRVKQHTPIAKLSQNQKHKYKVIQNANETFIHHSDSTSTNRYTIEL